MFQKHDQSKTSGGILKQKVYYNNWTANSIAQLKKRIMWALSKIDPKLVQSLAKDVYKRYKL